MTNTNLLGYLLELEQPWQILQIRNDLRSRQVDIWIGTEAPKRSWMFGRRPSVEQASECVWRHANLGTMRCVIHASLSGNEDTTDLPWCGKVDMPFTRAMALKVTTLISHGMSFQQVCTLLDIPVEDLWKFRHRLDSGQAGLSADEVPTVTMPAVQAGGQGRVADPDDAVWEKLLDGSTDIDIRLLSLKLLLTKLREQMQAITDKEVRMLKRYELQRYFVRHEKQLGHELAQLGRH
jgi:hypothetical protein